MYCCQSAIDGLTATAKKSKKTGIDCKKVLANRDDLCYNEKM